MIAERYHVKYHVDMVDTPAFKSNVIAYPAITVITNEPAGPTRMAKQPPLDPDVVASLAKAMGDPTKAFSVPVTEVSIVAQGSEPWMLGALDRWAIVRKLEAMLPTIEEAGCRVGIGVATGADKVFIGQCQAHVVYDDGEFYPHHNLYYVTSEDWDLKALQAVLLSGIATLFVAAYSTRMAGGFLRFQAQYLRRIRIPRWTHVPDDLKVELVLVAAEGDAEACNQVVFNLYGLSKEEQAVIKGSEE